MRSTFVVVAPPAFDLRCRLLDRLEPMDVQAFVPKRSVERLDEAVSRRHPRAAEVDLDPVMIRPEIQHPSRDLAAVVDEVPLRGPMLRHEAIADANNSPPRSLLLTSIASALRLKTSKIARARKRSPLTG